MALLTIPFVATSHSRSAADAPTKAITLVYSNDFHAAVAPVTATWLVDRPKIGGALDFAGWIAMLRRTEPNAFLFDSGDLYTGQAISFLTRDQALVDIWKAIGFDAVCLGNHEFDYGVDGALRYVRGETFPVLSSNLFYKSSGAPFAQPYAIVQRNGIKIAVIGVFGPEIKLTTTIATWDTLEIRDPVPILNQLIPRLRQQADLIVVLAHEGLPGPMQSDAEVHPEVQRNFDADKTLAASVPGIDVLISGHPHRGIEVPWVSPATGTIIVQTYGLGTTLGVLRLTVDTAHHRVISQNGALLRVMDGVFAPPANVAAVVKSWEAQAQAEGSKPIGALITDAMLSQTGAQMAFENAGGIRGDLPRGQLTRSDAISALPFMNTAVEMELSGADIRAALEQSLTLEAGMLQIAGLNVLYDPMLGAYHRVLNIAVGNERLEDARMYKIVASSFVAQGGDHYESFLHGKNVHDTGELLCDILTNYAHKVHTLAADPTNRMVQTHQWLIAPTALLFH